MKNERLIDKRFSLDLLFFCGSWLGQQRLVLRAALDGSKAELDLAGGNVEQHVKVRHKRVRRIEKRRWLVVLKHEMTTKKKERKKVSAHFGFYFFFL